MNEIKLDEYSVVIRQKLDDLIRENGFGSGAQRIVELDQQSIGRLSRMDALQSQAMAKAQQRRREGQRQALIQTLCRTKEDEFGDCIDFGGKVDVARLRANTTITCCMSCTRD